MSSTNKWNVFCNAVTFGKFFKERQEVGIHADDLGLGIDKVFYLIVIDKEEIDMDEEELMMAALDAGAEDFAAEEDSYEITTAPDDFSAVRETLEAAGIPMASAEVTMIPQTYTELTDEEDIKKMNKLLEMLDDDDDVQNTYHNWDE